MDRQLFDTEKKPITQQDRDRLGAELARVDLALTAMKEEKSDVSRAYRVKIRELEETSHDLSRQLDAGIVEHRFEVEEVPDDARHMIVVMRKGTREQLNTRPMTEAEKAASAKRRQADLFDADGDGADDDGARAAPRARAKPGGSKGRGRAKAKPNGQGDRV